MIEHAYPSKRYKSTNFEEQLAKAVSSIKNNIPRIGINNPKIGNEDGTWRYCGPSDWVSSFWTGQLWLCSEESPNDFYKNH